MANKPTAAANRKDSTDPATAGRIKQIRMVAGIIRKSNPRALPIVALAGIGVIAVFVIVGLVTGLVGPLTPLGVAFGLMVAMIIFGRYAQSAQYKAVEGQPGAAAALGGPTWTLRPWLVLDAGVIVPLAGWLPRSVDAGVTYNAGRL